MQTDEKICPFCCEVIKKQALRCKHCQAGLGGGGPAAASYGTTGAAKGVTVGGSGHHIEGGIHITNLTELEEIDEAKKQELLSRYQSEVRAFPERAQVHFALGLSYLDLRLYNQALSSLKQALGKGSREAGLYFYIALASLGGKQPRVLTFARIKEIESYLEAAVRSGAGPEAAILWAIIKYDYYLSNGLRVNSPSIEELLAAAQQGRAKHSEARIILKHLSLPPSPLRSIVAKI